MAKSSSLYKNQGNLINSIGYFIFYLMVGLIPHIYRYVEFTPAASESAYFKNNIFADLYMLAKSRLFLFLTVALLCVFVYQVMTKKVKLIKDKIFMGTGVAALIVVLSSVFSPYQDLVYWGAKDRFEGMWVWLAYLVIFTVARHYGSNKQFVNRLLKVFVLSAGVMAVFGLMQINGYDIYTEGPLRWLCFPKEIASDMATYMVTNTTEELAVGALYNSNYFGVYSAVAAISGLVLFFNGGLKTQVIFGLMAALNYGAVIASRSEAALFGFSVAVFALLLANTKQLWERKWFSVVLIVAMVFVDRKTASMLQGGQSSDAVYIYALMGFMAVLGVLSSLLLNKFEKVLMMVKNHAVILSVVAILAVVFGFNVIFGMLPITTNPHMLEAVTMEENTLTIQMQDDEMLKIEFMIKGINAYGGDGRVIMAEPVAENVMTLSTVHNTYKMNFKYYSNGYVATIESPLEFHLFYDGKNIQYVDPITGMGTIAYPERIAYYYEKGAAITERGYIWGTYLPIMQDYFLLGSGVDSYLPVFPQNDVIGKYNYYGDSGSLVVDKPHSTYIMTGLAMGIFGLVLLMLLIVMLIKTYLKSLGNPEAQFNIMALLTVIFIAGIFNDSVIPVSILMFGFSGAFLARQHRDSI